MMADRACVGSAEMVDWLSDRLTHPPNPAISMVGRINQNNENILCNFSLSRLFAIEYFIGSGRICFLAKRGHCKE